MGIPREKMGGGKLGWDLERSISFNRTSISKQKRIKQAKQKHKKDNVRLKNRTEFFFNLIDLFGEQYSDFFFFNPVVFNFKRITCQ